MNTDEPGFQDGPDESGSAEAYDFPVVGMGASAGGLEAVTRLLSGFPERPAMAFLLVQHLDPKHESHLASILSKVSPIPVMEAAEGMSIAAGNLYIIPPNTEMAIARKRLKLKPREPARGAHMPIDHFLSSLAAEAQNKAIGVILSGTGSDGTLGMAEIKAAGGVTFAQDEQSAKQPGMPRSVVEEGVVDYILPPEKIAKELLRISLHPYFSQAVSAVEEVSPLETKADFRQILALLRSHSGVDFNHYRDTTLKRRILRRMALHRLETMADYVRRLTEDRSEIQSLYQEVLINVTRFFRDPPVFDLLKNDVFPEILKGKSSGSAIRIWVVGCATGEEAYSLGMALYEFLDGQQKRPAIRIFASDISEIPALEKARAGAYPESIEADVSPERLRRFFTQEGSRYRINKDIRDMCVFALHNVASDPPFSRLDLISCRNLLIYLSPALQRKIIPTFHYALNPAGFLVLGLSETIGRDTELFSILDPKLKVYAKKLTASRLPPVFVHDRPSPPAAFPEPASYLPATSDYERAADRVLLRRFSPPGVLVNRDLDVLQFRGRTSPYLEPPQGEASFNLAKMATEVLLLELREGVREAEKRNASIHRRGLRIRDGGRILDVGLEVIPVRPPERGESCFLILFHEEKPGQGEGAEPPTAKAPPPSEEGETALLRAELAAARDYLQTIREQYDAVNEELKSSNEEILSSNEELQSTNEELETAKEELQSTNEELTTMNDELRSRNVELVQLSNDLGNLLASVNIPIVMLGSDLRIRRHTLAAEKTFHLTVSDVGRVFGGSHPAFETPDLEQAILKVIDSVSPEVREVRDKDGRWHALRIQPYRTLDNKIDGAVLVLEDITERKLQLQHSENRYLLLFETAGDAILVLDAQAERIIDSNPSAADLFGCSRDALAGKPPWEIGLFGSEEEGRNRIRELRDKGFLRLECLPLAAGEGRQREVELTGNVHEAGAGKVIQLNLRDITGRRRAERDLKLFKFICDQSQDPYYLMNREGRFRYTNRSAYSRLGYTEAELMALAYSDINPDYGGERFAGLFDQAQTTRVPPFETAHVTREGEAFPVECSVTGLHFEGEAFLLAVVRDIGDRKKAEEALHRSEEKLRHSQRVEAVGKLAGGISHDFNNC